MKQLSKRYLILVLVSIAFIIAGTNESVFFYAAGVALMIVFMDFVIGFRKRKFQKHLELSQKFKMNQRFVNLEYSKMKAKFKSDSLLIRKLKHDAGVQANDEGEKLITLKHQLIAKRQRVSIKLKIKVAFINLYKKGLKRHYLAIAKVEYMNK